jgi:hypothetical protein
MKGLYSSVNFVTELRVLLYEMGKMWYDGGSEGMRPGDFRLPGGNPAEYGGIYGTLGESLYPWPWTGC